MNKGSEQHDKVPAVPVMDPEKSEETTVFCNEYQAVVAMSGLVTSIGKASGRAVVVMNKHDVARVKDGAVIISKITSKDLVRVMSRACAIVMEGAQESSISWFARKYGIPAVVGVKGLMKAVRDGDLVRVNGITGTVEIMKQN